MPKFRVEKDKPELVDINKVIWFGKHKGKTIKQIIESGEGHYIQWCIQQEIFELDCVGEDFLSESLPVKEGEDEHRQE